jgi:ABC-2 type transport system ATP-binding protein
VTYDWMTVNELLWFTSKFYKTWNDAVASELVKKFGLEPKRKIRHLSRGMRAELFLILALAPEPRLLILDDPTSGMDPIVRREFLEKVAEVVQDRKRTVFFSSHILSDIERVADWVGILKDGKLLIQSELESLKLRTRKIIAKFETAPPKELDLGKSLWVQRENSTISAVLADYQEDIPGNLKALGATALDDIFVEYLGPEKE